MKNQFFILFFALMMVLDLSAQDFQCGGKMKDFDGNEYNTVQIANHCWMKENMRACYDANGKEIAVGSEVSYSIPYRYFPNSTSSNVDKYGYLYNYVAALSICPSGWRLPTTDDFDELMSYSGSRSKAGSYANFIDKNQNNSEDWRTPNEQNGLGNNLSSENSSRFSALPAGALLAESSMLYRYFGDVACFWSLTTDGSNGAHVLLINHSSNKVQMMSNYRNCGFSVRCIKSEN